MASGGSRKRVRGRPARTGRGGVGRVLRGMAVIAIWGTLAIAALVGWYAYDLPEVARIERATARQPTITVLAADGAEIARIGGYHGAALRLSEMPPYLPRAVLAIEDRRFYSHPGVDPIGILRAALANILAGRIRQGGSTITQQLAKNLFLTRERTLRRKVQETLLALWLERRFTKDEILTIYLNRVYFGAGAYGVEAAARRYFAKSARHLSLFEAAVLAGLLKAPSRDNPLVAPKRAARRAGRVLAGMVDAGWLDPDTAARARRETVRTVRSRRLGSGSRYFADWIIDRIGGFVGYHDRDLVVRTTLDARLQRLAERLVARTLTRGASRRVGQAAFLALAPDGAVRAMVGGRDYAKSQFNRATQALRQPGSAFKLFVYLAALEAGLKPDDRVEDRPVTVRGWTPRNAGGGHRGSVTLREGIARSLNSVAVVLAERVGRKRVIEVARRLGLTSTLRPEPSLALGTFEVSLLELTAAYAVIANGGRGVWPYGIREIRDSGGRVLYRRTGGGPGRVVRPEHVAALNDLLSAVVEWGTGRAARLDRPAAGKTGTSQDNRDAWFIGYTPDLVAGVWLGNDDGRPMKGVGGGSLPAALWRDFMASALKGVPPRPFPGLAPPPSAGGRPAPLGAVGPAGRAGSSPMSRRPRRMGVSRASATRRCGARDRRPRPPRRAVRAPRYRPGARFRDRRRRAGATT